MSAIRVSLVREERVPIDRQADEQTWLKAVFSEGYILTKFGDAGQILSSSSMPEMVFEMLRHLDVEPRQTVLEIGTGTGWNAGLLAHRLGPHCVHSVEIDPEVAEFARNNLKKLFHPIPTVITGDGEEGWAESAPYDRLIATCSIRWVPLAWVAQIKPGGVIVTPWHQDNDGLLLRLEVQGAGRAAGRFVDWASFMNLSGQRWYRFTIEPDDFEEVATVSHTDLRDVAVMMSDDMRAAIGLKIPDMRITLDTNDETGYLELRWFLASDAWASVDPYDGTVRQHGACNLWDEVVAAHEWWESVGCPKLTQFGVAVEPDRQWVWLDEPSQVVQETRLTI